MHKKAVKESALALFLILAAMLGTYLLAALLNRIFTFVGIDLWILFLLGGCTLTVAVGIILAAGPAQAEIESSRERLIDTTRH